MMAKVQPLADELDDAASILEAGRVRFDADFPRAINLLRHVAARERNKGKAKGKAKTVVGYVGPRHVKVKVKGDFDLAHEKE